MRLPKCITFYAPLRSVAMVHRPNQLSACTPGGQSSARVLLLALWAQALTKADLFRSSSAFWGIFFQISLYFGYYRSVDLGFYPVGWPPTL